MYNYNEQIESYEDTSVRLPFEKEQQLYKQRQANRDRLKENRPSKIRLNDKHFIPQGSMAMQTTIQETNSEYDIDDGVWLYREDLVKDDGVAYTAKDTQEMVCRALKDDKFNKPPKIQGNAVRVFYAEGHHVDVPSYRVLDADTDKEKQELAGENGWVSSDPTEINKWFEKRVQELNKQRESLGNQMRKVIRMLKRFARSRGDKWDMPNGLKLTMLVEELMPTAYERDDEAFHWLISKLRTRLALSLEVENRAQTKWPKDKLTKTTSDSNMVELRTRVGEAFDKLIVLHHPDCIQKHAREAWDWVFQSDGFFEAYDEDAKQAKALFAKASLINAGLASTNSRGVIVSSALGTGIANLAHSFHGDEDSTIER